MLLFGGWEQHGSIAALLGTLKLVALRDLRHTPLNFETGLVPAPWIDQAAFAARTHSVRRVATLRNEARTRRSAAGTTLTGDLENSDWDYSARVLGRDMPSAKAPLHAFVPIDSICHDGRVARASRPVIGRSVRRGEPRLPRFLALRVRERSDVAIQTLVAASLVVIDLRHARGVLTSQLVRDVLSTIGPHRPVLLLAEGGAELSAFGDSDLLAGLVRSEPLVHSRFEVSFDVIALSRARVASEEQMRYSLPTGSLSPQSAELVELALAAWRTSWRMLAPESAENRALGQFRQSLERLRRQHPSDAAQFALVDRVLSGETQSFNQFARERTEAAVTAVAGLNRRRAKTLVIVGSAFDASHLRSTLLARGLLASTMVLTWRDQLDSPARADACVVCASYGPATLDAALRSRASEILLLNEPIEGRHLAAALHRQAEVLNRTGLSDAANLVGSADGKLASAFAGVSLGGQERSEAELRVLLGGPSNTPHLNAGISYVPELIDESGEFVVVFASGLRVRALSSRKLDVLGVGSPHARLVRVDELEIGDQVLLVRGEQQRTLSDLLIEDMDRDELREQAEKRRAWSAIVRAVAASTQNAPSHVAAVLRGQGIYASTQRIRSWLRADDEETTPRDFHTFAAFAHAVGVPVSEDVLTDFFQAIRRWRVAHQQRGRQIVRAMRLAWSGSLSANALRSFQDRWGLAARDLVEGSRVEEVEEVILMNDGASVQ